MVAERKLQQPSKTGETIVLTGHKGTIALIVTLEWYNYALANNHIHVGWKTDVEKYDDEHMMMWTL